MNKFILKYKSLTLVTLAVLSLSSCLKDKGYENGTYGLGSITGGEFISIGKASLNPNPLSLESKAGDQTIGLCEVTYDYVNAASEDITVTFVKNDAAVTAADATLTLLPSSVWSLPSSTVTIPKGARVSGTLSFKINTATLDPTKAYGMALSIASTSKSSAVIPANLKTVVFKIALKNQWDGIYSIVSGLVTRYSAPGVPANDVLSGSITGNPDVYLITTGPTEVGIPIAGAVGCFQWAYGNNSSVAGIDGLRMTIDPATNQTTMISVGYATSNATLSNWAGKENSYTPATKTFKLNFRWNPASTTREYTVELKYKKSR